MEIEYKLDLEDVIAFEKYNLFHGPPSVRMNTTKPRMFTALCIVVALGLVCWDVYRLGDILPIGQLLVAMSPNLVFLILVSALHFYLTPKRFIDRYLRKRARKGLFDAALVHLKLAMSAEQITILTADGGSMLKWRAMDRIEIVPGYAYFFNSPGSAVIVPRAVFENDWDFQEFVDQAKEYLAAARKDPERA